LVEEIGRYIAGVQDRLLAERLRAGDDSALAEVFDRHGAFVLGQARRVTGSTAAAEDVVQEVFTALWSRPDRYDPDRASLRTFLGVLAHRRAVDAVRSSARRQAREDVFEAGGVPAEWRDLADATAVAETVRCAIERLPEDQRRAIELAFWHGMTHPEVAAALGIPEGTVKSRLRLAQAKLRDWLGPLTLETV
jgi:RNA polymerase sigma-70 factor (ECF subfamily)